MFRRAPLGSSTDDKHHTTHCGRSHRTRPRAWRRRLRLVQHEQHKEAAVKAAEERVHRADQEIAARERQATADKAALEAELRRKAEQEGAAKKAAEEDARRKAEEQGHVYEKEFEKYCKEHGSSATVHCPESNGGSGGASAP